MSANFDTINVVSGSLNIGSGTSYDIILSVRLFLTKIIRILILLSLELIAFYIMMLRLIDWA
jgi:hypothetical protein